MSIEQKKSTYVGLDIGKFLCAFLILFYHYFSEHGSLPGILDEILSLYAVAVALFMSISGFLLFNKLENVVKTQDRWAIVRTQVARIYSIYLLWSIPYLLFSISRWNWESITLGYVLWQIQGWVFSSTFYTIWFMPMLALGLVLTFLLTEKLPMWSVYVLAAICYAIGSLSLTYQFVGNRIPGFTVFVSFSSLWLGGARGWLFYAFPLIMVGRSLARVKDRVKSLPMACGSLMCVGIMLGEALLLRKLSGRHTGIDMTVMMIPTVYCVLGFLISTRPPYGKYCVWMRNTSTLIFMSQRLFLTVIPLSFPRIGEVMFADKYIGAMVLLALEVGLACLIIRLSSKYPALRKLY